MPKKKPQMFMVLDEDNQIAQIGDRAATEAYLGSESFAYGTQKYPVFKIEPVDYKVSLKLETKVNWEDEAATAIPVTAEVTLEGGK